jgi:hypothetical protein
MLKSQPLGEYQMKTMNNKCASRRALRSSNCSSSLPYSDIGGDLFPVFARAREMHAVPVVKATQQIGLAFMQYSQDYDEKNVLSFSHNYGQGWDATLSAYMTEKSVEVLHWYCNAPAILKPVSQT